MKRLHWILLLMILLIPTESISAKKKTEKSDREIWCDVMYRMAAPVLSNMSEGLLKQNMLVELSPTWDGRNQNVTYMECFGRLMAGLAPWLSLPDDETPEGLQRKQLREWALKSYANAVDPASPDYLLWRQENQTLVDAAFLAESFLRSYDALWMPLDSITKQRYIAEFTDLRRVDPSYSNWLLFSATVESFLRKAGAPSDTYRISSSLRKIEEWYVGDGWYSDGPRFAFDYYNSFVIHPMMVEVLEIMKKNGIESSIPYDLELERYARYAEQQERMISPDGAYPVIGRSIAYRFGTFHVLSTAALKDLLPTTITKSQVRCGLTAVIKRHMAIKGNFDEHGWLTLGFAGHQPQIAERYISTGSLYLCSTVFTALGLPVTDEFWSAPYEEWTGKKIWSGNPNVKLDKAIKL